MEPTPLSHLCPTEEEAGAWGVCDWDIPLSQAGEPGSELSFYKAFLSLIIFTLRASYRVFIAEIFLTCLLNLKLT